jgi:hypothetical protein
MMTQEKFQKITAGISREAGVVVKQDAYFEEHAVRIYDLCVRFNPLDRDLGDVLDNGPFYAYKARGKKLLIGKLYQAVYRWAASRTRWRWPSISARSGRSFSPTSFSTSSDSNPSPVLARSF